MHAALGRNKPERLAALVYIGYSYADRIYDLNSRRTAMNSAATSDSDTKKRKRKKSLEGNNSNSQVGNDADTYEESIQQPVWHVIALNVLTMFAYSLYWFYKTWRDLKAHADKRLGEKNKSSDQSEWMKLADVSPIIRAVGIIIPVWQLYLTFTLFRSIARVSPLVEDKRATTVAIALTVAVAGLCALAALPGAWFFLYLTTTIPIAIAQHQLNDYWRTQEDSKLLVRHAFTPLELVAIIIGASWLGLCIAGFMIVPIQK